MGLTHLYIDTHGSKIEEICISTSFQLEENKPVIKIISFDSGITLQKDICD
ncbi:hypothetical protein MHB48_02545 [Psychrobacillus sp. FSL H8-0483]|uniref:hypothetical protein n=1 Tax=Psychrobacillus sp. FSL H8-0483 TaxID=2921389 RepID=UPI003159C5FC